jgi:hypothetical protein
MPQPISGTFTSEYDLVQNAETVTCLFSPNRFFFIVGVSNIVEQALARLIAGTGQVWQRSAVQR